MNALRPFGTSETIYQLTWYTIPENQNLYQNRCGNFKFCDSRQVMHSFTLFSIVNVFFFCATAPPVGQGLLIHEVSKSHTMTHQSQQDSSERGISSSQNLYLTTHNTHNRKTSTPPVGFEPTISAGERPQTYALDRAATETGNSKLYHIKILLPLIRK